MIRRLRLLSHRTLLLCAAGAVLSGRLIVALIWSGIEPMPPIETAIHVLAFAAALFVAFVRELTEDALRNQFEGAGEGAASTVVAPSTVRPGLGRLPVVPLPPLSIPGDLP